MLSVALVDRHGHIMRNDNARAVGRAGDYFVELSPDDVIPLPEGATLMRLPGRTPVGVANTLGRAGRVERADAASGGEEFVLAGPGEAVSVMLPGGYTRTLLPAYQAGPDAPALPLFGYTAVAFDGDELVVAAVRTDERDTWDPRHYNLDLLPGAVRERLSRAPQNRVLAQLARCSLEYGCFTAQNVFYRRWEGGIPVSPACNARCIGCISEQPSECCPSPQQRINFVPTPDEVAEVAIEHLENAPEGIISFGQGCEGEPTLQHALIAESVRRVRRATTRGTININTNAGNTAAIREVCEAGVDSLRVSLISALPEMYGLPSPSRLWPRGCGPVYYARKVNGGFRVAELPVLSGVLRYRAEVDALVSLIDDTDVNMVQLRNLNIDPDVFSSTMLKPFPAREPRGVANVIQHLQDCFPELLIGNFSTAVADVHED